MLALADWNPKDSLVKSSYVATFAQMGEVYIYHDIYGYILKMSPDILDFLDAFKVPTLADKVCLEFGGAFGEQAPESFVSILFQYGCLVPDGTDELAGLGDKFPVRSPWNVWKRQDDGSLVFYTAWGERPVKTHQLSVEEARLWGEIDGETRLKDLLEGTNESTLAGLVERLVHHDIQALKVSQVPLSFYKGRQHMKPPYLESTMPYASYCHGRDPIPEPLGAEPSPVSYYENEIQDSNRQFDHQETTLSHLFRMPHPALAGRTYGQALIEGLASRADFPAAIDHVLEVGGGLGKVARSVLETLQAKGVEAGYDIVELSPALAAAQRDETQGLPVTVQIGNILDTPLPRPVYDLILANEMLGDLPVGKLSHEQAGLDQEDLQGDAFQARLAEQGPAGEIISRYTLPIGDAPDPFYVNLGAIKLVELAWEALKPGGMAVFTEFGEMSRWPILSSQLDHPEFSIHFGHLMVVARSLGFEADLVFVMDLLDMDRDMEGMKTTRSYFRALQSLLAHKDIPISKVGYTREMIEHLLEGKVDMESIGDFHFAPIEERLMGLVPFEFKALVLTRPC